MTDNTENQSIEYEVHTANEDGWTDYHEEDETTDDMEVAVHWLSQPDVVWGTIAVDGKEIAHTEEIEYEDEQDEYDQRYNPRPKNRIVFEDGWNRYGRCN